MNRIERVKNLFARKPVDFLPNQIEFSDRGRHGAIAAKLGIPGGAEGLVKYLDNNFVFSFTHIDLPKAVRSVTEKDLIDSLVRSGFAGIDRERGVIYDLWGVGYQLDMDSIYICYNPLAGDTEKNKIAEEFLPPSFCRDLLYMDLEDAIRAYEPPDFRRPGAYDRLKADIAQFGGDYVIWASGHFGIFETAYCVLGFEQYMTESALRPNLLHELIEKITDVKVLDAKEKTKLGLFYGHYGDDLGNQRGLMFSQNDFRTFLKKPTKRIFDVFHEANMTVGMHSCGNVTDLLPDLIEIGLNVLEPVQPCMDLRCLKERFGNELIFWGGIDTQDLLPFGTPERVRKETREAFRTLGKNDGYVAAPSHEIMSQVPLENVVAMLEVFFEERELHGTW